MKKILIPVIVLMFSGLGCSSEVESYLIDCNLLSVTSDNIEFSQLQRDEYSYDKEGKETGHIVYFNNNFFHTNINYRHDEYGNVTYVENVNDGGEFNLKTTSTFMANKKPLSIHTEYVLSNRIFHEEFAYNSSGLENAYKRYVNDTLIYFRKNYRHDRYGNISYFEYFNGEGELMYHTTISYLAYDKILTSVLVANNSEYSREVYVYDDSSKEIGHQHYLFGELKNENINYDHDNYGNVTYFENVDSNGVTIQKKSFVYSCIE